LIGPLSTIIFTGSWVQIHLGYLNLNSVRIGTINSKWHATSIDDIKKTLHLDPVKTADDEKEQ